MDKRIKFSDIIKTKKVFFSLFAAYLIFGAIYLFIYSHADGFVIINHFRAPFLDVFFYWATWIGDGIVFIAVILIFLFIKTKWSLLALSAYASSGILTQIIKHIVQAPRPSSYFADSVLVKAVEGIPLWCCNSFPSGHSASGFALFLFFALLTKNKIIEIFCFIGAFVIGISRIYLGQHFPVDVYFGSIIGVILTVFSYYFISNSSKISNSQLMNNSIIASFKKGKDNEPKH